MSDRLFRPSSRLSTVAAVIGVLTATLVLIAPGTASAATCTKRVLVVVAHEDDDILFLNPDIAHDISQGACVKTVYVTAGDAGRGSVFWRAREKGAEAASASLAGVASHWSTTTVKTAGGTAQLATLTTHPQIQSEFLRLPDGGILVSYWRWNAFGYASMASLWDNPSTSTPTVDAASRYDRAALLSTLQSIIKGFNPNVIRIQNRFVYPDSDVDHSDHHMAARFTAAAAKAAGFTGTLWSYLGYDLNARSDILPPNLDDDPTGQQRKVDAMIAYTRFDPGPCASPPCTDISGFGGDYQAFLKAQYRTTALHPRTAIEAADGSCLGTPSGGFVSTWSCTDVGHPPNIWKYQSATKHVVIDTGQCLESTGTQVELAACSSDASQKWNVPAFFGTITDSSGKCLAAGSPVALGTCINDPSQAWGFGITPPPIVHFMLGESGDAKCMAVQNGSTADGTPVESTDCVAIFGSQQWRMSLSGEIVGYGNNCLRFPDPHVAGTGAVMSPCTGNADEHWRIRDFSLVGVGGFCLQHPPGVVTSGTTLALAKCDGHEWQDFRQFVM